jgi:hypothetical protein
VADQGDEEPPEGLAAAADEVLAALPDSTAVSKLDLHAVAHGEQTLKFRGMYGRVLLGALLAQLALADAVFIVYAWRGVRWDIPSGVMTAWLSATVVEVIGVVYAITRSLFPLADKGIGETKL